MKGPKYEVLELREREVRLAFRTNVRTVELPTKFVWELIEAARYSLELEARVGELEGAAKAMIDSASYAGDLPPLADTGERWLIAVEFEKWAALDAALSDTREEGGGG